MSPIKRTGQKPKPKAKPGRPPLPEGTEKTTKPISAYIEKDLLATLKKTAKAEGRTLNGQIVFILKKYFDE